MNAHLHISRWQCIKLRGILMCDVCDHNMREPSGEKWYAKKKSRKVLIFIFCWCCWHNLLPFFDVQGHSIWVSEWERKIIIFFLRLWFRFGHAEEFHKVFFTKWRNKHKCWTDSKAHFLNHYCEGVYGANFSLYIFNSPD